MKLRKSVEEILSMGEKLGLGEPVLRAPGEEVTEWFSVLFPVQYRRDEGKVVGLAPSGDYPFLFLALSERGDRTGLSVHVLLCKATFTPEEWEELAARLSPRLLKGGANYRLVLAWNSKSWEGRLLFMGSYPLEGFWKELPQDLEEAKGALRDFLAGLGDKEVEAPILSFPRYHDA